MRTPRPHVYFTKNTVVKENATDNSTCLVSGLMHTLFFYSTT